MSLLLGVHEVVVLHKCCTSLSVGSTYVDPALVLCQLTLLDIIPRSPGLYLHATCWALCQVTLLHTRKPIYCSGLLFCLLLVCSFLRIQPGQVPSLSASLVSYLSGPNVAPDVTP
jgi:hypothetical protein